VTVHTDAVAPDRRLRDLLLPLVATLAVLALVLVGLLGVAAAKVPPRTAAADQQNAVAAARESALGAATSSVATILSYSYKTLDRDFSRAEAQLTPRFRKQYLSTTAKAVRPLATRYRATSSAQVAAAGVVSATADRAVVLVFVDQTETNSRLSAPRLDRPRIKVSLVRSGGRWLVDGLTTI
jgi:Mce-associated membrane protein